MSNPIYDVIVGNIPQARDPDPNWAYDDKKSDECEHEMKLEETYLHTHAVQTRAQKAAEEKPVRALKVSSALPEVTADEIRKGQQDDTE